MAGNAIEDNMDDGGIGGVDVGDSGAVIAGNLYGDLYGDSTKKLGESLLKEDLIEDTRGVLGCKRLEGIWPAVSRAVYNKCEGAIDKGLFARGFAFPLRPLHSYG